MHVSFTTNDQLMVMAAHRYCLGRRSYIVESCIQSLHDIWIQLTLDTQEVILRDTEKAISRNEAGDNIDVHLWQQFIRDHPTQIS